MDVRQKYVCLASPFTNTTVVDTHDHSIIHVQSVSSVATTLSSLRIRFPTLPALHAVHRDVDTNLAIYMWIAATIHIQNHEGSANCGCNIIPCAHCSLHHSHCKCIFLNIKGRSIRSGPAFLPWTPAPVTWELRRGSSLVHSGFFFN